MVMNNIFLVCNRDGRWVEEVVIEKSFKKVIKEKEIDYSGLIVIQVTPKDIKNIIEKLLELGGNGNER